MYLEAMDKIIEAARANGEKYADRRREVSDLQLAIRVALSIMSDDQIRRLLSAISGAPFRTMGEVELGDPDVAENVRILAERRRRALALELENNRIIAAREADAEAEEMRRDRRRDDELENPTTQRDVDLEAERLDAIEEGREAREAARDSATQQSDVQEAIGRGLRCPCGEMSSDDCAGECGRLDR